jgi:glycosyltransferase involved in cell wall biosynthesis
VSGSVELVGALTHEEVDELLRTARVAVVPSRSEAFGMVVLEAWAAGTPVVATDRGGPAGLIRANVDGILTDPEQIGEFAATLRRVIDDDDLRYRLALAGAARVPEYTWARVATEYGRIYDRIGARHQR